MPIRHLPAGVAVAASNPASGLVGARLVGKTRPWTTVSMALR